MVFDGNTVVGWDLDDDMKSLCLEKHFRTEDLSYFFLDEANQKRKLKDVYLHFKPPKPAEDVDSGNDGFQCGIHSAIQDARATRDVHLEIQKWAKNNPNSITYPFNIPRSPKVDWKTDPTDICRCQKKKKNKSKITNNLFFEPE